MSQVKLTADSGGGTTSLKAPSSTTSNADVVLKLPVADGSANQVLKTDGSGQLSFTSNAGTTINNNADNRVITGSSTANTLNGESNVFIESNGRLGIGTSSPSYPLHVNSGTANSVARFESTDAGVELEFKDSTGTGFLQCQNDFRFKNSSGEMARIDSSGRVMIGTTSTSGISSAGDDLIIGSIGDSTSRGITFATTTDATIRWADAGDNSMGRIQYVNSTDIMSFHTSNAQRLTIDSSGFVGIGESSPSSYDLGARTLVISQGGTLAGMTIRASQQGGIYFADGTSGNESYRGRIEYIHADDALRFGTAATERMRIDSSGRVGIGTTTTNNPDIADGGLQIRPNHTNGAPDVHFTRASSSNTSSVVGFVNGNVGVGSITYTNSGTAFNTSSDYRLKENVVSISDAITRIKTLKPYKFNFIGDSKIVDGFLAHEVSPVVPEAITGEKDAVDSADKPIYQGIDQAKLVPLLTAALQEEVAKREALEARVAALEAA